MVKIQVTPTQNEITFGDGELIVSKTDLKGHITYANDVFMRVSQFDEHELIGQPHSVIRHPDMPRCVFKLLWDTISQGGEVFAYVKNIARNGDYYWVFAHVTPTFDEGGNIIGYHSNRRSPDRHAVEVMSVLYAHLLKEERRHSNAKDGLNAGFQMLSNILETQGIPYDEFIFTMGNIESSDGLAKALSGYN
ncbi:MAG: chemotaxis protein [Kordiimonas sp.]|nr:chemotaxis protein [Kordiimonas sp.]|tara:strand:- start:5040 stop:5615 length:576 start_codon:yes stop_codon:yes gene_type:complete